ncbi:hypothetical protein MFUR16E_12580 [Methylobacterium fujisawaense]|uniref:hypothetical protein n=1 Tax=Methylobacterium fujisawaense TaxID=107400 RepID=UPI002F2F0FE3
MRIRYFNRIPFDDHDTLILIREAALRILRRHGRTFIDAQGPMLVAKVDGYTFRYYSLAEDAEAFPELPPLLDNGETGWPSATHCIDVEGSELLFGLAHDVDGLAHRRIVRGPWEHEIARAGGLEGQFRNDLPLPPCIPESRCRVSWPLMALKQVRKRRLCGPVRYSIAGYTRCIHGLLPPGFDFGRIVTEIERSYRKSRASDGELEPPDGLPVSSFGIWGWAGERPVRLGKRMKKPDVAYWVSRTGGYEAAAAILLLLDKEHSAKRSLSRVSVRAADSVNAQGSRTT